MGLNYSRFRIETNHQEARSMMCIYIYGYISYTNHVQYQRLRNKKHDTYLCPAMWNEMAWKSVINYICTRMKRIKQKETWTTQKETWTTQNDVIQQRRVDAYKTTWLVVLCHIGILQFELCRVQMTYIGEHHRRTHIHACSWHLEDLMLNLTGIGASRENRTLVRLLAQWTVLVANKIAHARTRRNRK